jgi:hypothetical protein
MAIQQGDSVHSGRLLVLVVLLIHLIVAPVGVAAQDNMSGEVLREAGVAIESTANYAPVIRSPVSLPDAPSFQRSKVVDKKFLAIMASLGATETLRYTAHKLVLDNEYTAGAPWVTSVPRNDHLIVKYAAIYAAEWIVAYELKKPHSWLPGDKYIQKFWWAYPTAMGTIHLKNGIRSIRTQASTGCSGAECQTQ